MRYVLMSKILLVTIVILTFSCQRKSEETSNVTLQLPTYSKASALAACTKCLKVLVVNASGADFQTIFQQIKAAKFEEAGTEINSEIELSIPIGSSRTIQVMAAYSENGKIILQYGKTTVDLNLALPPPISLALTNLGEFKGGSIVGRYITSTDGTHDYGPTGKVGINIVEPSSGLEMEIQQGEILNGWFDFFASENFNIKYKMKDASGTLLFGQAMTLGVFTLPNYANFGFTNGNSATRMHRPNNYYKNEGSTPWQLVTEYHDIVYGFFSPQANLINDLANPLNSRVVCVEGVASSSDVTMSSMAASSDGSSPMTYYHDETSLSGLSTSVRGNSNLDSFNDAAYCSPTLTTANARYADKRIYINKKQLDGKGNDTAIGMAGAFSYSSNASGDVTKYSGAFPSIHFKVLPGLFSVLSTAALAPFDSVKIYKKSNTYNGGFDDAQCSDAWLSSSGFTDATSVMTSTSSGADNIHITFNTGTHPVFVQDAYLLCPAKSSQLTGHKGFYLGNLGYTSLSYPGTTTMSGGGGTPLNITNTGSASTNIISAVLTSNNSRINFAGGSYPGTAGTCGSVLHSANVCTIDLACSSSGDTANLSVVYSGSNGNQTKNYDLSCP